MVKPRVLDGKNPAFWMVKLPGGGGISEVSAEKLWLGGYGGLVE